MTRDDIIRMAREAGIDAESDTLCRYEGWVEPLERFAGLVAAAEREHRAFEIAECYRCGWDGGVKAEREACAKVCEAQIEEWVDDRPRYAASECAAAIRARSEK